MINKILFITTIIFFLVQDMAFGQYESSVTNPDTSREINDDVNNLSNRLASTITDYDMRMHLTILASDEYEGRETGEKGNEMAADYISKYFDYLGFDKISDENGYYQPVTLTFSKWDETVMNVNGEKHKFLWDYLAFPNMNKNIPLIETSEVIYLGYGIDSERYSDYRGHDLKDKVILINKGEPLKTDSTSWVTGHYGTSEWDIKKKLERAKEKGVKLVLIIEDDIKKMLGENRRKLLGSVVELDDLSDDDIPTANHAYISSTIAAEIIGNNREEIIASRKKLTSTGVPTAITLPADFSMEQKKEVKHLNGNNVLGYLEGRDPELKEELLVISAHYDHLGKRGDDVYNGADDNGSGTTTVLELAEAFKKAYDEGKGPRRSVLFLLVTGEEKGLLGSQYYSERPVFPLENTIADINIDMVGRVDEKYTGNPDYIYVIGSDRLSTDLHKINEEINQEYTQLTLDYTYNSEADPNRYYFRSDHYNFAKNGIPAIFFFNGTHADYHKITDTVEKIEFEKMEKIGKHIFHLAWELSNRDERIRVDGEIK